MNHSLTLSRTLCHETGDPLASLARWQSEGVAGARLLLVDFSLHQTWLAKPTALALTAIYYLDGQDRLWVSVTDRALSQTKSDPQQQYAAWARQHQFARMCRGQPLALSPTFIPKPWGREIWFTGVEQRGVCKVEGGGGETPIPWMQAVMPGETMGEGGLPLILLKILDPVAQAVVGDLYFELHEEKREVYVVTHIDSGAWPGGSGYIRFGFAAAKRAGYADDDSFRQAYLEAVQRYESVRRQLDDDKETPQLQAARLAEDEGRLRAEMDSFTHMKPLHVGDVVKVPLLTPHALQHGVRTIEFQTPVYERKILSFAQKVLTQDHWDTPAAVAQMYLDQPPPDQFEVLQEEEGVRVERIVDFSDFEVRRVRLSQGQSLGGFCLTSYALVMVVQGQLAVGEAQFEAEQALLLPLGWQDSLRAAQAATTLVFLLALPRNTAVES